MPNIRDVARTAGVSTATVSRVINSPEKVLSGTLKKVQDAMTLLNYNPADNRRTLVYNNTRTILVVMPDFTNTFLIDVLSGINGAALRAGYSILLFATNSIMEREKETIKFLNKRQADGVIILSSKMDDGELERIAASYPLVQCCEYSRTSSLPHVSIDNYTAYKDALEFLIKMGYKKIASLSTTEDIVSTNLREAAYRDVIAAHGFHYPPGYLRRGSHTFISGYENMQALLKSSDRPDAVLGADATAAGAIRAVHEAGLRIPEDIAIMGIDGLALCTMITPTLTTISQPRRRLGQTAFAMMLRQITGEVNQQSIFLPHELIVRNST